MAATAVSAPAPVPPAPASSNMVASDVAPSQTLYLNNLNEKLKKGALKKGLYAVFTQFGPVMDIVACRTNRLRGQAWVVFENVADATNALRQMQGFPFFDKPMRIQFAKEKSDVVAKLDGTFVPRQKRALDADGDVDAAPKRVAAPASHGAAAAPVMIPAPPRPENAVPTHVLLASNLPESVPTETITALFAQYPGFTELRPVPGRGMAFVEYESEVAATPALQGLHNHKLDEAHYMAVTYAKK
ncbi:unnamed protein product [Symbiodinium sp. KB8]|nr:unnamed protein product [Symbiodinium sp. KB8]